MKSLVIEVTGRCMNKCLHCSSNSSCEIKNFISFEKFKEIVSYANSIGVREFIFSGGEPLLHPDIYNMVRYARENLPEFTVITLYTSGIKENSEGKVGPLTRNDMILLFTRGGLTKLIFDIPTVNPSNYMAFCGQPFIYVEDSFNTAISMRHGLVEINCVPTDFTSKDIYDVFLYGASRNIRVNFLGLTMQGRAMVYSNLVALSYEKKKEITENLLRLHKVFPEYLRIGRSLRMQDNIVRYACDCDASRGDKIVINYKGEVHICESFKNTKLDTELKPDNIYDTTLAEIVENSEFLKYERKYLDKECYVSKHCDFCCPIYAKDVE